MPHKPSLNSAGIYVPSSKKKAMPALLKTTHGLPSRAVAAALTHTHAHTHAHSHTHSHSHPPTHTHTQTHTIYILY